MKTLIESLFDDKLIEKDILDNSAFKQWINQPNILWYIYYYWNGGEDDWLTDFAPKEWELYKPFVDNILEIVNKSMKKTLGSYEYSWFMINFDQYYYAESIKDKFIDEDEFYDMMNDANYEILKKHTDEKDGISKLSFRGPLPKGGVTALLLQLEEKFAKPGLVDGGFFLTNEDTIMVIAFPKGTPKNILELFNLK